MLPAPIYKLPQELIDRVVDLLYSMNGAYEDECRSYALVCRSFLSRSRSHIFRAITIGSSTSIRGKNRRRRTKKLEKILKNNPSIADYIQEVNLLVTDSDNTWVSSDSRWLRVHKLLMKSATPFRKLAVKGYSRGMNGPLVSLSKKFTPFLFPFVTSLHLNRLSGIPILALSGFLHLEELALISVKLDDSTRRLPDSVQRPSLRLLDVSNSGDAIEMLTKEHPEESHGPIDFSRLRVLKADFALFKDIPTVQKILNVSHGSIEEITLLPRTMPVEVVGEYDAEDILGGLNAMLQTINTAAARFELHIALEDSNYKHRRGFTASWDRFARELKRIANTVRMEVFLSFTYNIGDEDERDSGNLLLQEIQRQMRLQRHFDLVVGLLTTTSITQNSLKEWVFKRYLKLKQILLIWDLEQSYHKSYRLYLPISLSEPKDIKFQLLIGVCTSHNSGDYDYSAFRISARSRELPGHITHLVIYEYDVARSPFQITPIAEKVTTLFFGRHSTILGDILAFSEHQGELTLWNFVNDTYSKLDIGWKWRYTSVLALLISPAKFEINKRPLTAGRIIRTLIVGRSKIKRREDKPSYHFPDRNRKEDYDRLGADQIAGVRQGSNLVRVVISRHRPTIFAIASVTPLL
ncbi:hypothetical protein NLJ89_g10255 [Agrocybe chaxingu]|uniref:Uncharacterized protein n=1 Tax=Agrocybe chaxingu TaxID=84603 RepID=A0A9W8MQG1_9AGAR|nr:hypothetical protein NLJ89_g10255 [Agrocybe chaxingu]